MQSERQPLEGNNLTTRLPATLPTDSKQLLSHQICCPVFSASLLCWWFVWFKFKILFNDLKIPKKAPLYLLTQTVRVTCHNHFVPLEGGSILIMLSAFRVGDKVGGRSTWCRGANDDLSLQAWVDLQTSDVPCCNFNPVHNHLRRCGS